jgi:hypothetical protein
MDRRKRLSHIIMNFAGLDLGQVRDHSAMVIVERGAGDGPYYVRYVERVRLGTPYPQVVEWVRRIGAQPEMQGRSALAVDATGVGAPVVEMLRAARLGCTLTPVTITSGEREHETGAMWHVPKKDLLAGVQVLLEQGRLRVPLRGRVRRNSQIAARPRRDGAMAAQGMKRAKTVPENAEAIAM